MEIYWPRLDPADAVASLFICDILRVVDTHGILSSKTNRVSVTNGIDNQTVLLEQMRLLMALHGGYQTQFVNDFMSV